MTKDCRHLAPFLGGGCVILSDCQLPGLHSISHR